MGERLIHFADLERALAARDPRLADLVCAFAAQPDPPPGTPEDHDPSAPRPPQPDWTLARVRQAQGKWQLYGKSDEEKKAIRQEAWRQLESIEHPPPRLKLTDFVLELDRLAQEESDAFARQQLLAIVGQVRIGWGIWRGLKQLYKTSEARFDAELFGLFAWRFDQIYRTPQTNEVGGATYAYLRRRAWRFLRHLGTALPELYPSFAVQVMRHYTGNALWGTWVLPQIWAHEQLKYSTSSWITRPPEDLSQRAFDEAWKASPDPLLRLLEDGQQDQVLDFAIRSLQRDFPDALRSPDVPWLVRLGSRPQGRLHQFVVETLSANPDFHQSKLKAAGLHDLVVGLLLSPDAKAAQYAVEYAEAHAPNLDDDFLIKALSAPQKAVKDLALARLEKRPAKELGFERLCKLLPSHTSFADKKLQEGFAPSDFTAELWLEVQLNYAAARAVRTWFTAAKASVPTAFLKAQVEDKRFGSSAVRSALQELGKRPVAELGVAWIQAAVMDPRFAHTAQQWLRNGKLKGADLDVAWVKTLVMRQSTRNMAFHVLQHHVEPARVGLAWLLEMSRNPDAVVANFATRQLLQHFAPEDFEKGELRGVDAIWALLDPAEADAVRRFAATYLQLHHPVLGPRTEAARSYGVQPRLTSADYGAARVLPAAKDVLPEIRRFAVLVAREELVRWGDGAVLYHLAGHPQGEARRLGCAALRALGASRDAGDLAGGRDDAWRPTDPVPIAWLDGAALFELTESRHKATREAALEGIAAHYDAVGTTERLVWLMESPERDVRLFAVRLLWARRDSDFEDRAALQLFVRRILFGLPPGRMERRGDDALKRRPVPASTAKRWLIEVVRDMAVASEGFAEVALAPLAAFAESEAKGEWHACVAALARIRKAHPSLGAREELSVLGGAGTTQAEGEARA